MKDEDIKQLTELMLGDSIPKMLSIIHENKKLQQENNNLKTSLDESQEVVIDLQQENERLKEDLIGQENLAMAFSKTSHDYYQRIEKAIKYIKDKGCFDNECNYFYDDLSPNELTELLNILKGEDNECIN